MPITGQVTGPSYLMDPLSKSKSHLISKSAFNQYLQLDGPPEANVFLSTAEDGYMSKWEITSDWDDISSMFM